MATGKDEQDATDDFHLAAEALARREAGKAETRYDWVRRVYTGEVAVIVTDLSGFTSTTRLYGIVHFASIIIRKRQLCYPILHKYNAEDISVEADNLIAVFLDPRDAVKAALEMRMAIFSYNDSLEKTRKHFQIKFSGVGVHCEKGLLVDKHGELQGEAYAQAYAIGEDMCEDGDILITRSVMDAVLGSDSQPDALFSKVACWAACGIASPCSRSRPRSCLSRTRRA